VAESTGVSRSPFSAPPGLSLERTGRLARLSPLDRALLLTLGPLWLICLATFVHQATRGGIVWPGVRVSRPEAPDRYPVVIGFWPGMGAEGSGLRPGDELVRVGSAFLGGVGPIGFFARALEERGTEHAVSVTYRRAGTDGEAVLNLAPFPIPMWVYVLLPLSFAALGAVVVLRAPTENEARSVFHAGIAITFFFLIWSGGPRIQTYAWLIVTLASALAVFPLCLRAVLLFPEGVAPESRWFRAAPWAFALLAPILTSWWFGVPLAHGIGFRALMLLSVAFVLATMVASLLNYRRGDAVTRRKMRWRLYGVCLGMTPVLCIATVGVLKPDLPQFATLLFTSCLAIVAIPIALTIAILRYNVFDIDRLISVTASYSILSFLVVAGAFVLVSRVAEALSGVMGVERSVGQLGLSLMLAALMVPAQRWLRPRIDRVFFAERYAVEQGVERLLSELSECGDPEALLVLAATRLDALLQPESTTLYACHGERYEAVFERGGAPPAAIDTQQPLITVLQQHHGPIATDTGAGAWIGEPLDPFDRAALEKLGASVIVPVRSNGDLVAFLSLSSKRSGDVYTGTDRSWLRAVTDKLSGELLRLQYAERIRREQPSQQRLRRYVPGAVAEQLDGGGELETSAREVSVAAVTAPARAPAPSVPATVAGGRYRVERLLGEGAKKRVYLAHDTRLERAVALAFVKSEGFDEAARARIGREARAMGRLGDNPHIVTVLDVAEEGEHTYIVSQLMTGGSVADLLDRTETHRLPVEQAVRLADQICQALEHAHARRIIHRDLKPGNVWLTQDGTAKLGDFGLALALDRSRLTLEGMMVGTVTYMPPEQALGRPPDGRSDLYALGAMLYEMLTGRPPFLGDDAVAIISQHINTPPVAPSWHNPDVPRALEALVLRLLAKAPEDRPESASAVRQALAAVAIAKPASGEQSATAEANPLDRLASGVFVGREREMDELRAGLEESLSGHGRILLLVGEPGIGKTRTAEELVTYARLRKVQVLWGRCYEGDGAPAYWPWVLAIRSYVHERGPQELLAEMGSGASDIAQMVSEVRERLPGLPPPPELAPEQARFRLFDSIATFLRNATKRQSLLLVLDDLHWADKPSLLLLQFLARELRGVRLLLIGTYRDVDVGRQHPLSQALAELAREQLAQRILLRGLGEHDVARFIEATAGLKPPRALVDAVYKETEGNPFFVNEVVRLLVSEGKLEDPERTKSWSVSIPQGVREVVGRRLDHLSPECNRVLTIAAVIGREFGFEPLTHLTSLAEEHLVELLDEAVAARVIAEVPRAAGRYLFAHALIRETLYEELSASRRVRMHRQVGEVLEQLYGGHSDPHLAELAYHFFEAAHGGDVDKAIAYAVRAGDRAAALMAHEEAARQFELALQAFELREPRAEAHRCELLLRLGDTLWRAGEYDRARETALQAAEVARCFGTPEQLARAALGYGGRLLAFAAVKRNETLGALLEEALAAIGEGDSALRARLLSRLAEEATFFDSYERRAALCEEAIAIARRLQDPAVLATTLVHAHWALWVAGGLEQRLDVASEIVELAEQIGDRIMVMEGHAFRVWDLLELGNATAATREFELVAHLAEELRQPYFRWAAMVIRVQLAMNGGRLTEAASLAQQCLELGQEAQNDNAALAFGVQTMLLMRERGLTQDAEPLVAGFAAIYPAILPQLRCAQLLTHVDAARAAEARVEFENLAGADFADLPRNSTWLFTVASLAEVCAFLRDERRAETLYGLLVPFAGRNVTINALSALGAVSRYLGLLAATLGRSEDAARHFEDALAMNTRMGTRQALARTQVEYGELLLADGNAASRAKALALLNEAVETARALEMRLVVEHAVAAKLRAQGVTRGRGSVSLDAVATLVQKERPDLRAHAAPDGTVTILFTDIEGSAAMTERLGDHRAQEVLRAHNRIVREQVSAHGGFEVKSQGDGFMVAFQSARRALACAIALQRAFAAYTERHPETPIRVRIGLHTGEPIKEADDFFGTAVIQAARIAAQAEGGEILVSALLRELTEGSGEFGFGEPRAVELKGLSGTRQVAAVRW
jgi:class 3 adenylate cyclase